MGTTLFLQYLSSVITLGLGCGTCCSPYISIFLSTYTLSHAQNVKKSIKIFTTFFLGKLTAIIVICSITSLIGKQWIDVNGYIGSINLHYLIEVGLLLVGIFLICNWIYQKNKKNEHKHCEGNCGTQKYEKLSPFAVGLFYGFTPCAPMMLLMVYTLMLSFGKSIILALVFTVVSSLSPMLIMILIAGVLSQKMYAEIPKWIDWIRLICYIFFIIIALFLLLKDKL